MCCYIVPIKNTRNSVLTRYLHSSGGVKMKIAHRIWTASEGWGLQGSSDIGDADLVIMFASTEPLTHHYLFEDIKRYYPKAHLMTGAPCAPHNQTMTVATFAEE